MNLLMFRKEDVEGCRKQVQRAKDYDLVYVSIAATKLEELLNDYEKLVHRVTVLELTHV